MRNQPEIDVDCHGDPVEVGEAIGSALQDKIRSAELALLNFETFRMFQPWWMPTSMYVYLAQWRARAQLAPTIEAAFPAMAKRLVGIAQGANTSLDFLYLFHAMESANTASYNVDPALAACTAIASCGSRTSHGQAVVVHNFDLVPSTSELLSLRRNGGSGPLRSIGMTLAPMAGVIDGINEKGLAITYNYAGTTDVRDGGPPISLAIDETLSTCATVNQAAERLTQYPRGGGALLMLADAQGEIASLELSAHRHALRRCSDTNTLSHSNAFRSEYMQQFELPRTAVYAQSAPQALRGKPIFQSAESRDRRLARLLDEHGSLDVEELATVLADHGSDSQPSGDTICMHGEHWSTLASVHLLPRERSIRVSYGPACMAEHRTFAL